MRCNFLLLFPFFFFSFSLSFSLSSLPSTILLPRAYAWTLSRAGFTVRAYALEILLEQNINESVMNSYIDIVWQLFDRQMRATRLYLRRNHLGRLSTGFPSQMEHSCFIGTNTVKFCRVSRETVYLCKYSPILSAKTVDFSQFVYVFVTREESE